MINLRKYLWEANIIQKKKKTDSLLYGGLENKLENLVTRNHQISQVKNI